MKMLSWPRTSPRRAAQVALLAFASLAATACGDDSTAPGGPISDVEVLVIPYDQPTTNLLRGITLQLLAVPINGDSDFVDIPITWTSSDNARATVDANGVVTTVGGGDVTISAAAGGKTGTFDLNIQYPVQTVAVSTPPGSIRQEGTTTLTATLTGSDGQPAVGRTVTWSSSNNAIATVNSSGVVTGVADGTVTITATSEGVSGTRDVTVAGSPLVANIVVTPASPFKGIGQTQQMAANPRSAASNTVPGVAITWSSNNANASVSATGLVTCDAVGTSTITATADNGIGTSVSGNTTITCATLLTSGAAANAPTVDPGTAYYYAIEVPAGATSLSVSGTGGTGDADLYLFAPGTVPSAINADPNALAFSNVPATLRSTNSGNDEARTVASPAAGTWRIAVFSWAGADAVTGFSVTATVAP
ncbi:MAG TPA: Ig-like domain-containing protein [Gemmatimonadaceae bacterium]|nr:Ig-like domain-containing protein [Gemmatimonadaceae bacterium]